MCIQCTPMQNKYAPFILGALIIALVAFATFWYFDFNPFKTAQPKDPEVGGSGITIAHSIIDASIPAPKVPRKVTFPPSMSKEVQKIIGGHIKTLSENIESNPLNISNWLDLALQYKAVDDVEGAREIWEYLTRAAPQQGISFYNLGYLYHISLKDYVKSEEYYDKAIAIEPNTELYYTGLHELYRYSYKQNTENAVLTLKEGMGHLPKSINLALTLAGYYRDERKDKTNAVKYFAQARDLAKENGDDRLVMTLDKEISSLK